MSTPGPRRLDPPAHFDAARREIWEQTVARLTSGGQVFRADPDVLAAYTEAVFTNRRAAQLLTQTDVLVIRDGRAVANPAVDVQRRTAASIATLSRTLGLGKNPIAEALAASPMAADQARWCEEHQRRECRHHRQDGAWCHQWRLVAGTDTCRKHGGKTVEALREDGRVARARLFGSPRDVTPVEALLEEVRWSAGHVAALREELAALEGGPAGGAAGPPGVAGEPAGQGLWWGTVKVVTRDGEVTERVEQAGKHVIAVAYDEERTHLTRVAHAAITAGAQQEAVDVARAVGSGLGRILDAIFARLLDLPPELAAVPGAAQLADWQRAQVPVVVPAVLREYDPAAEPA